MKNTLILTGWGWPDYACAAAIALRHWKQADILGMSTSRLLEFDNLRNTRDLGGLKARGGRTILPGKLIRSGQLVGLSEKDSQRLSSLVGTVVDMRTDGEREENPDVVLEGVRYIHNPIVYLI